MTNRQNTIKFPVQPRLENLIQNVNIEQPKQKSQVVVVMDVSPIALVEAPVAFEGLN